MLENHEGQHVPDVTFKVREGNNWKDVTTKDLFAGKNVAVFSLPGAFTPTCSGSHVPRFNDLAPVFKENGIDSIVCLSVNDTFVMNEWKKDQHADNITFIPDGNGEFTEKMGLLVDKNNLGFGKRSWRYSMIVRDRVIEKMFIEPEVDGDPFEVSDADTMLKFINPEAKTKDYVTIFTKNDCSFCTKAKALLHEHNMPYEEVKLGDNVTSRSLLAVSGSKTTPQVFIGGKLIGDSVALEAYLKNTSK